MFLGCLKFLIFFWGERYMLGPSLRIRKMAAFLIIFPMSSKCPSHHSSAICIGPLVCKMSTGDFCGRMLRCTVLSVKSESDVMFCLQNYQGLRIDRSLV